MPELRVRRLLHALGYRFRLHRADLPGKPDIVFPARRKVIFVHGCFWHRHRCRKGQSMPTTRAEIWAAKFEANTVRDRKARYQLRKRSWKVLVVWECQTKDLLTLARRCSAFLEP